MEGGQEAGEPDGTPSAQRDGISAISFHRAAGTGAGPPAGGQGTNLWPGSPPRANSLRRATYVRAAGIWKSTA